MKEKKTMLKPISGGMGWGQCSVCGCAEFKGNSNICERCGHSYSEHW